MAPCQLCAGGLDALLTVRDYPANFVIVTPVKASWIAKQFGGSFGALANVGTASFLFKRHTFWALSALAGIVVGTVWNYAMTATYNVGEALAKIQC